jgi:hypothetical protein
MEKVTLYAGRYGRAYYGIKGARSRLFLNVEGTRTCINRPFALPERALPLPHLDLGFLVFILDAR